jgi:hypothetical protein
MKSYKDKDGNRILEYKKHNGLLSKKIKVKLRKYINSNTKLYYHIENNKQLLHKTK